MTVLDPTSPLLCTLKEIQFECLKNGKENKTDLSNLSFNFYTKINKWCFLFSQSFTNTLSKACTIYVYIFNPAMHEGLLADNRWCMYMYSFSFFRSLYSLSFFLRFSSSHTVQICQTSSLTMSASISTYVDTKDEMHIHLSFYRWCAKGRTIDYLFICAFALSFGWKPNMEKHMYQM